LLASPVLNNRIMATVKECNIWEVCEVLDNQRKVVCLNSESLCKAIIWVVDRGEEQVVQLLLKNGADVNAHDASGFSMLHLAS